MNFFLKSVNIWQSYKQERDCLVHALSSLSSALVRRAKCKQVEATATVLLHNFAKYSPILIFFHSHSAINKIGSYTIPSNLLLRACFADNVSRGSVAT